MPLIDALFLHVLTLCLESTLHDTEPHALLSAWCTLILVAALHGHTQAAGRVAVRERLLFGVMAWGTVLLWAVCVLLLRRFGLA